MSNPTDRYLRAEREQRIERVLGPARASQLPIRDFDKLYTLVGDLVDDAERLRGEVARLQSERDAAIEQRDSVHVTLSELNRLGAEAINANRRAEMYDEKWNAAETMIERLRSEVTAAKADDEGRARRAVEVWYSRSPNDPEWANPVHRMSAAIRAADARAELDSE